MRTDATVDVRAYTVEELKSHISEFLTFVENPLSQGKYEILEKHLAVIYSDGLNLSVSVEPSLEKPQTAEYEELRKSIEKNFHELGFYHTILNPQEIIVEPELAIGDAIDDFTDIVKDLKEVISLTDDNTFLWQFHFNFKSHFKDHLINLINYLNGLER